MSLVISTMFIAFPYGPNGSKRGIHLSVRSTTSHCLPFSHALPIVCPSVCHVCLYIWLDKSQLRYSHQQRRGARSQSQTVTVRISCTRQSSRTQHYQVSTETSHLQDVYYPNRFSGRQYRKAVLRSVADTNRHRAGPRRIVQRDDSTYFIQFSTLRL